MGKSFIIRNQRSLNGQPTNAVLVTLKSGQKLVETFEEKYYSFKDTYLEDILNHMTYEERVEDVDGFVSQVKPFFLRRILSTTSETMGRKYKLYGITNADLEVFLYLHKKCYTNGVIPNVTIHMMWEDYKQYKEEFSYIQHSQFYIALRKLSLHNIITIEKNSDGRYTIKLTHFMNEETEKANAYVYISPVVFTKAFFELSVAAKKLFVDIAMQQHSETTLKRSLDKQDERGNKTHFGGMYRFLHKKYPHQIRAVIAELTTALPCTGAPLFKICKLQKGVQNKKRYTTLYLSIHTDFLCTKESGEIQY
ncbi:putative pXO1 ORF16-like protein [Bacillus clarus]|uniref:Putative pXO1 ORF16-like protein n=1 Tax=Bacillus clarus TaxID=2338372 RepID=A0A090YUI2_9BACI|nr:putative pXO1 ORF16-like protein [Bacillus clarus]